MFPNGVAITVKDAAQEIVALVSIPANPPFTVVPNVKTPVAVSISQSGPPGANGQNGSGMKSKSGIVAAISFTGTPRKSSVVFATPYPDATYSLCLTGQDARLFTYEAKNASGFTINANSNGALTGEVSWLATVSGESP